MPRPRRGLRRSRDLAEIARRTLAGESPTEIAQALRLPASQVARDLAHLKKEWLASAELERFFDQDLETLAEVMGALREGWQRSTETLHSVCQESWKEADGPHTRTTLFTHTLPGDPAFIELALQCAALRKEVCCRERALSIAADRHLRQEERPLRSVPLDLLLFEVKRRRVNLERSSPPPAPRIERPPSRPPRTLRNRD